MYIIEKGLSYQMLILVVQEKMDYPIFVGLTPWTELTPSPLYSLFTTSFSCSTVRADQDPLVAISRFLHGILEFLGGFKSPRTGVSDPPSIFPILRYFPLSINLFAPCMDLKFLQCIVSIHVLELYPAISLSFFG
jgi:hypothetical protein